MASTMLPINEDDDHWTNRFILYHYSHPKTTGLLSLNVVVITLLVVFVFIRYHKSRRPAFNPNFNRLDTSQLEKADILSSLQSSIPEEDATALSVINSGILIARAEKQEDSQNSYQNSPIPGTWRRPSYPFILNPQDQETTPTGDGMLVSPVIRDEVAIFPDESGTGFWRRRVVEFHSCPVVESEDYIDENTSE